MSKKRKYLIGGMELIVDDSLGVGEWHLVTPPKKEIKCVWCKNYYGKCRYCVEEELIQLRCQLAVAEFKAEMLLKIRKAAKQISGGGNGRRIMEGLIETIKENY